MKHEQLSRSNSVSQTDPLNVPTPLMKSCRQTVSQSVSFSVACPLDRPAGRPIDRPIHRPLVGWLVGWLACWVTDLMFAWPSRRRRRPAPLSPRRPCIVVGLPPPKNVSLPLLAAACSLDFISSIRCLLISSSHSIPARGRGHRRILHQLVSNQ